MIKFRDHDHRYLSINGDDVKWTSATGLVHKHCNPFDEEAQSKISSKARSSKWYMMEPSEILKVWKDENTRAVTEGSIYHKWREDNVFGFDKFKYLGKDLDIIKCEEDDIYKYAFDINNLKEGVYPELIIYDEDDNTCGQTDKAVVVSNMLFVDDFKTNKEIKMEGYQGAMMINGLEHIPDSNYWHYALQLSFYAKKILKKNKDLTLGGLMIDHVIFEEKGKCKYGYPITLKDDKGIPIVKDIVKYRLPFLSEEVDIMTKK